MTKIGREKLLEVPEGVLKPDYIIVAVHPDMSRSTTTDIYRRLSALKAFEGKTIGEALGMLSKSDTTPFHWFDMRCHVARKRIIVGGIDVYNEPHEPQPRIVDANAGVIYDWSGAVIGEAPKARATTADGTMSKTALIVGTGSGISAAFARALNAEGYRVALAARGAEKLAALARETGALAIAADATQAGSVANLFAEVDRQFGRLDVVLYNASYRRRGPFLDLEPREVARAIEVSAFGGFLVAQEAARRMVKQGDGAIFFTGASASVKGYAQSAPFAMGKFALRGLAQSLARELQPKGIHVAHFIIDGGVRSIERGRVEAEGAASDSLLDPAAIADTYMAVLKQARSAWSLEVELRPWVEKF